jgi:hypothetical protein
MQSNISNLSTEEQLAHYKNLAEKYERDLVNCHEAIVNLVGSQGSSRPSVTSVASRISHATKDAIKSYSHRTGYEPNNLEE